MAKYPSTVTRVSSKPSRLETGDIIKDREALEVDGDDLWGGFIKWQTPLSLSVVVAGLTEALSYDPLHRGKLGEFSEFSAPALGQGRLEGWRAEERGLG